MPEHDDTERLEFLMQFMVPAANTLVYNADESSVYVSDTIVRRNDLELALLNGRAPADSDILTIIDHAIDAQASHGQ